MQMLRFQTIIKYLAWAIVSCGLATLHVRAEETTPGNSPSFVNMDSMIFSVLQDSRISGLMSVTIKLQIRSEDERNQIEALRPKLRDRYLFTLTRLGAETIDIKKPLNFEIMTQLLQRDTDKVLGEHVAKLLITDMTTRAR